jgi:hypothetical protein
MVRLLTLVSQVANQTTWHDRMTGVASIRKKFTSRLSWQQFFPVDILPLAVGKTEGRPP